MKQHLRPVIVAPEDDGPPELNRSLSSPSSNSNSHYISGSEIIKLKLQIARQQEKLDMQSSQLRRTQAECETLKTENTSLVNELAATGIGEEEERSSSTGGASSRWFPRRRGSTNSPACHGGSMQLLLDTNAKLMMDNKRLQAECTNIRQCFQQYIVNGNGDSSKKKSSSKNKRDKQNRDSSNNPHNLSIENIHRVMKESTSRAHKKSINKKSSNRSEASRSTAKTSLADSTYCDDDEEEGGGGESVDQDEVRSLVKTVRTKTSDRRKQQKALTASLTASQEFVTSVDSLGWHTSFSELDHSIRRCGTQPPPI